MELMCGNEVSVEDGGLFIFVHYTGDIYISRDELVKMLEMVDKDSAERQRFQKLENRDWGIVYE